MRRSLRRAGWALAAVGGLGVASSASAQSPMRRMVPPNEPVMRVAAPVEEVIQVAETTPAPAALNDSQAHDEAARVELALLAEPMLFSYGLTTVLQGGMIEVRGYVPNPAVREHALKVAAQHTTLKVFDHIQIHPTVTTRTSVDSPDIIRNSARQLLDVSFGDLVRHVEVKADARGHLIVTGAVASMDDKLAVSRKLRRVGGCNCVDNRLVLATVEEVVSAPPAPKAPATPPQPAKVQAAPVVTRQETPPTLTPMPTVTLPPPRPVTPPAPALVTKPVMTILPPEPQTAPPVPAVTSPAPAPAVTTVKPAPATKWSDWQPPVPSAAKTTPPAPSAPVVETVKEPAPLKGPTWTDVPPTPPSPKMTPSLPPLTPLVKPAESPTLTPTKVSGSSSQPPKWTDMPPLPPAKPVAVPPKTPAPPALPALSAAPMPRPTAVATKPANELKIPDRPYVATGSIMFADDVPSRMAAGAVRQASATSRTEVPRQGNAAPVPESLRPGAGTKSGVAPSAARPSATTLAHLKQRIEAACGSGSHDIQVMSRGAKDLQVVVTVKSEAEAQRLSAKILEMPELAPYEIDLRVELR